MKPGPKTLYRLSIEWLSSLHKFLAENGWTEDNDGVWVVAASNYDNAIIAAVPYASEIDALRKLNTRDEWWSGDARVVFVPFGSYLIEVIR